MNISPEKVFEMYKTMLRIRRFEENVSKLYAKGKIPGFVHLYIGEEAVATGVCACLDPTDYITSTHRGHGHLIAKGGDLKKMMAELYGKRTGYCGGKGGSMHIADLSMGILGANGIVSGGIPISVGAAYGLKILKKDNVVVSFFGDGASNEGNFHESMNAAAAFKLPLVFVCENNQFGVSTRIDRITNNSDLAKRAEGYGMKGIRVDGTDVLKVYEATEDAVERARKESLPAFIVADTFRHHGHFEGENVTYWDKNELEAWKEKDPIVRLRKNLTIPFGISEEIIKMAENDIEAEISSAISFAEDSEYPEAEDALTGLYWER
ncbi:MAG TPA: thiamine pyrophosphate-dependent dehydrogenase E1 component subunit alpha [Desulfitobacteriaceae bacterium]|nr:thiamine pyrophosphate-dependent dehydrogenase E1 component subunit alpha [Desulfitobacteriaceae bacterium]